MKKKRTSASGKSGYILPIIMVAALIGILFGLGRLAMFRYQCQLRFDRQHALDRVMATRSALVWLENEPQPPNEETNFVYQAGNGRLVDVTVRPVPSIYPAPGSDHLNIYAGLTNAPNVTYSATSPEMLPGYVVGEDQDLVLKIGSSGTSSTGHVGRVFIDMVDLGSWQDDVYGRRYWLEPEAINAGDNGGDIYRFYLSPVGADPADTNTAAIWIEQVPDSAASAITVVWIRSPGELSDRLTLPVTDAPQFGKGIQLSGNNVTLFRWIQPAGPFGVYGFYSTVSLPAALAETFQNVDLRLTLEVESVRPDALKNTFRWIRVDPAYEFEIELAWDLPHSSARVTNLATVVHLRPSDPDDSSVEGKAFTYDTHGTEAK